jgi:hypothetical protein
MIGDPPLCSVEGCERPNRCRGLCDSHYTRLRKFGDVQAHLPLGPYRVKGCVVEGCEEPHTCRGYCRSHYYRFRRHGDPLAGQPRRKRRGEEGWKGNSGYVSVHIPDHPNASKQGVVLQHTLVMSQVLGRPLRKGENVHHKNGIRDDNRPENLELWRRGQPPGQRVADQIAWAIELLGLYAPDLLASEDVQLRAVA